MSLVEYWICHGKSLGELQTDVQRLCREGWVPLGSMLTYELTGNDYALNDRRQFAQPVVRRTER